MVGPETIYASHYQENKHILMCTPSVNFSKLSNVVRRLKRKKLMLVKMLPQIRNGGTLERVPIKFLEEEFKNTEHKYKQTKDTTNVKRWKDDSSGELNPHQGSKKYKVGQNPSGKPPKSHQEKSLMVAHNLTEDTEETVKEESQTSHE